MPRAILALLAWKAVNHLSGGQPGAAREPAPTPSPGNGAATLPGGSAGGLGDLFKGGLGGLLAGGAAGSVISGGGGGPFEKPPQSGPGATPNSWGGKAGKHPVFPAPPAPPPRPPPPLSPPSPSP